jgi:hypothetical protein
MIIVDTFSHAGWRVTTSGHPDDLEPNSHLLLLGVGNWGTETHGSLLRAAGERGVQRSLWQLETLPPPDLPSGWLTTVLLRNAPERTSGVWRFLERLGYQYLSRKCRDRTWNADFPFEGRQFGLPFREARKLIKLWQDRLIDRILVTQHSRQAFLASRFVPSHFFPFGYHPVWGRPLPDIQRDLDVVFLGTIRQGRERLLAQVQQTLAKEGFQLTIVDKDCYGEDRTRLLNRAKIVLYLRGYPWEMPRMRLLMAMSCRSMVLAETFQDTLPFRPGEHLVMSPQKELASTLVTYLRNDSARQRIIDAAHALLINDLGMEKCFIPAISAGGHQASIFQGSTVFDSIARHKKRPG